MAVVLTVAEKPTVIFILADDLGIGERGLLRLDCPRRRTSTSFRGGGLALHALLHGGALRAIAGADHERALCLPQWERRIRTRART